MTTLDPEKQKQAKQYARIRRRLWLVDTVFSALYFLAWIYFGWSITLRDWLAGIQHGGIPKVSSSSLHLLDRYFYGSSMFANPWLLVPAFVAVFGGIFFILNLPLGYYSGFVLPHRFGQSNQTLKGWITDQLKGLAVGLPLGLIVIEFMYLALRSAGDLWWLWAAAGLLVFNVLLINLAPILIMPLFNTYVPLGDEHRDLADRLLKLAERANTKVSGVFKFDMSKRTKSANAALTGIGNTRRIILGDTLINEFSPDEVETVLAHELGHHVNRDIPVLVTFGILSTTLGLYLASLGLNWAIDQFGFLSPADVAALPALGLIFGAYDLLTMPLNNAVSRWRENMADDYALNSTGKKEAFASAFTRLANQNLGDVDPEKWVVFMFYSHPPLGERIAKANTWK